MDQAGDGYREAAGVVRLIHNPARLHPRQEFRTSCRNDRCLPGMAGTGLNLGRDNLHPMPHEESAGTTAQALGNKRLSGAGTRVTA